MKTLILARYGQWENGHLNTDGVKTMNTFGERVKTILKEIKSIAIISADIPRAYESAKIIADHFGVKTIKKFIELYAAEEDGILPNAQSAYSIISSEGSLNDVVIAVISREYIEVLPDFISNTVFKKQITIDTKLQRGEAIIINYQTQEISII